MAITLVVGHERDVFHCTHLIQRLARGFFYLDDLTAQHGVAKRGLRRFRRTG